MKRLCLIRLPITKLFLRQQSGQHLLNISEFDQRCCCKIHFFCGQYIFLSIEIDNTWDFVQNSNHSHGSCTLICKIFLNLSV